MPAERRPTSRVHAVELACVAGSMLLCVAALIASPSSSHFVTSDGRVEDAGSLGLGYADALFLASFRRPVADPALLPRSDRAKAIRSRLLSDFAADRGPIEARMPAASDRELLLAYLTLRVHGSVSVFDPTSAIRDDLEDALLSSSGNCATLSMRLLMMLELFDVEARIVYWWSPAMEGHVFVDVFDPQERRAYFLDPTANIVVGLASGGRRFLDALDAFPHRDRRAAIEGGLTAFPHGFSRLENAALDFDEWAQANRLRTMDSTVSALTFGLPIASRKWAEAQMPAPAALRELGHVYPKLARAFTLDTQASSNPIDDP